METRGHVGAALLAFAPAAFALTAVDEPLLAVYGCVGVAALSMLPDLDCWLPITHRGPTHTVWFLVAVAGSLAAVGWIGPWALSDGRGALFAGGIGVVAVGSHFLADVITPMGIRPFWPITDRSYSLRMTLSRDRRWNAGFLGVGLSSAVLAAALGTFVGSVVA